MTTFEITFNTRDYAIRQQLQKAILARELMYQYLRREQERDRKMVVLTCVKSKVKMYEKMGFTDHGLSQSVWGGEQWNEMSCVLNI